MPVEFVSVPVVAAAPVVAAVPAELHFAAEQHKAVAELVASVAAEQEVGTEGQGASAPDIVAVGTAAELREQVQRFLERADFALTRSVNVVHDPERH